MHTPVSRRAAAPFTTGSRASRSDVSTSRTQYRASAYKPVSSKFCASEYQSHNCSTLDQRNFLKDIETLRKELDRKEARCASSSSEMQNLRTQFSTQQRELRILSGTFEKCNNERQRLANEVGRNKEYTDKLELQLTRLGDVKNLTTTVDRLQVTNDELDIERTSLRRNLESKSDRIRSLEKELEAHQRSVEVQLQYEQSNYRGADSNNHPGESSLRSLYYELGKRQTDAHSLAISLASSNQDAKELKELNHSLVSEKKKLVEEFAQLRAHCDTLTRQSIEDKDEIGVLLEKNAQLRGASNRLGGQVEDMSSRLSEERTAYDKFRSEIAGEEHRLKDTLKSQRTENGRLKTRIEGMQSSISHIESQRVELERRLTSSTKNIDAERGVYADKIREGKEAEKENAALKIQVQHLLRGREMEINSAEQSTTLAQEYSSQLDKLQVDINMYKAREAELLQDKNATVKALQQAIDSVKTLQSKFKDETVKRVAAEERVRAAEERMSAAEKIAESAHRAREHVGQAVIDQLQKEKSKTAQLEATVSSLTNTNSIIDGAQRQGQGQGQAPPDFGACGSGGAVLVDNDLFQPPLPPPSAEYAPMRNSIDSLRDSGGSLYSIGSVSSTNSANMRELARLREEVRQMEEQRP